jgi:hypothetical protein
VGTAATSSMAARHNNRKFFNKASGDGLGVWSLVRRHHRFNVVNRGQPHMAESVTRGQKAPITEPIAPAR